MLFPHNQRVKDPRCGFQRVNGRVNSKLRDGTIQYRGGIKMGESRCRSRVCQVVRRYIDCLHRCDGAVLCGSNPLLQSSHLRGKSRLIAYRRRHTPKQRRNLGACLSKSENIVYEKQYILPLFISEIFRHGKSCQSNPHSCSRRFVHLSEDHGCLFDNSGLDHFVI